LKFHIYNSRSDNGNDVLTRIEDTQILLSNIIQNLLNLEALIHLYHWQLGRSFLWNSYVFWCHGIHIMMSWRLAIDNKW